MAYLKGSVERPRTVHLEASSRRIERLATNLSVPEVWASATLSLSSRLVLRPPDSADYGTTFERCNDLVSFVSAETGNDTGDFSA